MSDFSIKSKELINFTLGLQRINDIALPLSVQNSLNSVVRDTKQRTLDQVTNQMFDVNKKTFFKTHSAYKPYKAKQFNYNINKLKADVMITKGKNPKEKAAEQVAHQPTAKPIKRGINPLGNKPQKKAIIDILSKKPEFVEDREKLRDGGRPVYNYIRAASRARRRKAPLVLLSSSGLTGSVNRVKTFRKRRPTKNNPNKSIIKMENIASYHKGGEVKLTKKYKFLDESLEKSAQETLSKKFVEEAEKQFERILKT